MQLRLSGDWTATRQVSVNGTEYAPGDTISIEDVLAEPKITTLIGGRYVTPSDDLKFRRTGDAIRLVKAQRDGSVGFVAEEASEPEPKEERPPRPTRAARRASRSTTAGGVSLKTKKD